MNIKELLKQANENAELIVAEMKSGQRSGGIDFAEDVEIKEMIGTDDGAAEFLEKVTYDVAASRDNVPLVYKPFYNTRTDANFPMTLTLKEFAPVQMVFLQHLEGGEVKMGTLGEGQEKSVSFKTWATGLQYDEDIVVYNQTWRVSDINDAIGFAYNHLLNHLHLSPIIEATYANTGTVAARALAQRDGTAQTVAFNTDIATTLADALAVLPNGRYLLVNSLDIPAIEDALASAMLPDNSANRVKRTLTMENVIAYDGAEVTVGDKTYEYAGVTQGEAFLISGSRRNFEELIKHDLRVDTDTADLSRLIITELVARARRAVAAAVGGRDGAVKVALS